ncbi:hypothetical protein DAI22_04g130100 [Oryza sativa Japonica Group]|nr:hypothetical protein DAI22_04g130100 [Oryza sativa Japonica Group]
MAYQYNGILYIILVILELETSEIFSGVDYSLQARKKRRSRQMSPPCRIILDSSGLN